MARSKGEELFLSQLQEHGFPPVEEEYKFLEYRRFRFDFAWPVHMIAVEIEGGTYTSGRHTRGAGFEKDCVKYNFAAREGWKVYRFPTKMVQNREAIKWMMGLFPQG